MCSVICTVAMKRCKTKQTEAKLCCHTAQQPVLGEERETAATSPPYFQAASTQAKRSPGVVGGTCSGENKTATRRGCRLPLPPTELPRLITRCSSRLQQDWGWKEEIEIYIQEPWQRTNHRRYYNFFFMASSVSFSSVFFNNIDTFHKEKDVKIL